jgi:hypothetical protein
MWISLTDRIRFFLQFNIVFIYKFKKKAGIRFKDPLYVVTNPRTVTTRMIFAHLNFTGMNPHPGSHAVRWLL